MHRLYYTSLLHSVVNTSVKQLIHLLEGSERAIKRYDCTATRSHCKNNNASLPTRRVTSRRCQAIVLKSYTLLLIHRASSTAEKPVDRVPAGVRLEVSLDAWLSAPTLNNRTRRSVKACGSERFTFRHLPFFSHTELGPNNSSFEFSSHDSHIATVLPGAQSTIVVYVESIRRRKEDHHTR